MYLKPVWILLSSFLLIKTSQAQTGPDQCRDILRNGFYENTTSISENQRASAEKAHYCSANLKQAKDFYQQSQSSSSGGGGSVSYGLFSAGGSAESADANSLTQEKFDLWKQNNCSDRSQEDSRRSFDYLSQTTVANNIVQSWLQCMMKIEGLTCWGTPSDETLYVAVNWKKTTTSKAKVVTSNTSNGRSLFASATQGQLLPVDYEVNLGALEIPIERTQNKSFSASLTLQHDGVNHSCKVFAPPNVDPTIGADASAYASIQPKQILNQPDFGCEVKAMDSPCIKSKKFSAEAGQKLCSATFHPSSGPTSGAQHDLRVTSAQTGELQVTVFPSMVPFGPGRWLKGTLRVTQVPGSMPSAVMTQKGCTLAN